MHYIRCISLHCDILQKQAFYYGMDLCKSVFKHIKNRWISDGTLKILLNTFCRLKSMVSSLMLLNLTRCNNCFNLEALITALKSIYFLL